MINEKNEQELATKDSSIFMLVIILVTVILSFIGGWILYAIFNSKLNDHDIKICKTTLTVFTIIDVILALIIIFTSIAMYSQAINYIS